MDEHAVLPNAVEMFTMLLLRGGDRYLLLERAPDKRFAPGLWTGLGGRVEPDELADLRASVLRELSEEAGIDADQIECLRLRRSLLLARPNNAITLLMYFTGALTPESQPLDCSEGVLHWIEQARISGLDLIDNAALVIPLLIEDVERDPNGDEPAKLGAAAYGADGTLRRIVWA